MTVEKLANSLADVVRENSELEKKNRLLIDANKRLVGQRDKAMKLAMTLSEAIDKNGEAFLKIIDHQPPGPPPVPLRPTPEIPEDNEEEEEEDEEGQLAVLPRRSTMKRRVLYENLFKTSKAKLRLIAIVAITESVWLFFLLLKNYIAAPSIAYYLPMAMTGVVMPGVVWKIWNETHGQKTKSTVTTDLLKLKSIATIPMSASMTQPKTATNAGANANDVNEFQKGVEELFR